MDATWAKIACGAALVAAVYVLGKKFVLRKRTVTGENERAMVGIVSQFLLPNMLDKLVEADPPFGAWISHGNRKQDFLFFGTVALVCRLMIQAGAILPKHKRRDSGIASLRALHDWNPKALLAMTDLNNFLGENIDEALSSPEGGSSVIGIWWAMNTKGDTLSDSEMNIAFRLGRAAIAVAELGCPTEAEMA